IGEFRHLIPADHVLGRGADMMDPALVSEIVVEAKRETTRALRNHIVRCRRLWLWLRRQHFLNRNSMRCQHFRRSFTEPRATEFFAVQLEGLALLDLAAVRKSVDECGHLSVNPCGIVG